MVFCSYCDICEIYEKPDCYAVIHSENDSAYKQCLVAMVNKLLNEDSREEVKGLDIEVVESD